MRSWRVGALTQPLSPRRRTRDRRAHLASHAGHAARGADGQPAGHGVLQAHCKPRWRERLPELAIPALVVHGRRDPFFPLGNGEALAREIPDARLLVLERAATAIPDAAASDAAAAMLAL